MKITDRELDIESILDIRRGSIPRGHRKCLSRHSDCFVLVLTGRADYNFGGSVYTAEAGDLIYLARASKYSIDVKCTNYTYIYIDFNFSLDVGLTLSNKIFRSQKLAELEQLFEQFYKAWKLATYPDKLYCKAILYMIYSQAARSDVTQYVSKKRRNDIERVAEYMSENIHDPELTVVKLASLCGVTEVHFRRLFECIYHKSPAKHLTSLRVRKAKELLIADSLSMAEISEVCGFRNQYYFSKVFKASTSMTPTEYRNGYKDLI